ncbi:hypothetical protein AAFF_G00067650 [Aldrovandia affinis]|uniref:Uncharacterized protein n=1 Tax=Aldrovandia affinis TaxID=143900 RepID=A0AAD7RZH8_9TELE|nr:hypothetical protein AAFF_G00067650 [Aldrovandia affinis]
MLPHWLKAPALCSADDRITSLRMWDFHLCGVLAEPPPGPLHTHPQAPPIPSGHGEPSESHGGERAAAIYETESGRVELPLASWGRASSWLSRRHAPGLLTIYHPGQGQPRCALRKTYEKRPCSRLKRIFNTSIDDETLITFRWESRRSAGQATPEAYPGSPFVIVTSDPCWPAGLQECGGMFTSSENDGVQVSVCVVFQLGSWTASTPTLQPAENIQL